jgi:predicted nucleic acid-binding protein/L-amino acid N-acyltransferase YncA
MKILIDTNIFIPAEDDGALPPNVEQLFNLANSGEHEIRVHADSLRDLKRDTNVARREASISRFQKYRSVASCWRKKTDLEEQFGQIRSENDEVDCKLLGSLTDGTVDLVVTEDSKLLKRAARAGLADGCMAIRDALHVLSESNWLRDTSQTFIRTVSCSSIDLSDPIFESLRADYNFDEWFKTKCVRQGRLAWVAEASGKYAGVVIFNQENESEADEGVIGSKILKLCTFKIADWARGLRLGELFLRKALWFAKNNQFDAVYFTAFPKQTALIGLSAGLGFETVSTRATGESTLARRMKAPSIERGDFLAAVTANYPSVPPITQSAAIIPIQPAFHKKLFPEASETPVGQTLPLFSLDFGAPSDTEIAPAAAIRKAYLCTAQTKEIKRGTPIVFYLTKTTEIAFGQCATGFGIAEQYIHATSVEDILKIARLRTVFAQDELQLMLKRKGFLKVLKFLFVGFFRDPVSLDELKRRKIVGGPPQSIAKIDGPKLSKLITDVGLSHRPRIQRPPPT